MKGNRIKKYDHTGQRFGRLTATARLAIPNPLRNDYWAVTCDCGKKRIVLGLNLRTGRTTSCGCSRRKK